MSDVAELPLLRLSCGAGRGPRRVEGVGSRPAPLAVQPPGTLLVFVLDGASERPGSGRVLAEGGRTGCGPHGCRTDAARPGPHAWPPDGPTQSGPPAGGRRTPAVACRAPLPRRTAVCGFTLGGIYSAVWSRRSFRSQCRTCFSGPSLSFCDSGVSPSRFIFRLWFVPSPSVRGVCAGRVCRAGVSKSLLREVSSLPPSVTDTAPCCVLALLGHLAAGEQCKVRSRRVLSTMRGV